MRLRLFCDSTQLFWRLDDNRIMPITLKYLPPDLKSAAEKFDFVSDGILDEQDFKRFADVHATYDYLDRNEDPEICGWYRDLNNRLSLPVNFDCGRLLSWPTTANDQFAKELLGNATQVIQKLLEKLQPKWNAVSRFEAMEYGTTLFLDYYLHSDRVLKGNWPYKIIKTLSDGDSTNVHLAGAIKVYDPKNGIDDTRNADVIFDVGLLNSGKMVMEHFRILLDGQLVPPQRYPDVLPDLLRPTELFFGKIRQQNWGLLADGLIPFDHDHSKLNPTAMVYLDTMAQVMIEYPSIHFEIIGHADRTGSGKHNQILGQKRARAVKKYLVEKMGPSSEARLTTISQGESGSLENTGDGEASYYNRNVQMRAYSTTELPHVNLETLPLKERDDDFVRGTPSNFHGRIGFKVYYLWDTLRTDKRKPNCNGYKPDPLPNGIKINDN